MTRLIPLVLALLQPATADGAQDARTVAQEILTRGAALFDTHDAAAMAATYTENAEILIYTKNNEGIIKIDPFRGRAEIEKGYAKVFKDNPDPTRSRNEVESAQFIGPNTLLIQGKFHILQTDKDNVITFIQVRVKEGDDWHILNLQLLGFAKD